MQDEQHQHPLLHLHLVVEHHIFKDEELVGIISFTLNFDAQHPIYKLGEGVWQMWSTLLQEALGALDRWNPGGPSDNWGTLETRGVASHLYYALYFSITPPSISLFHRPGFLCYTHLYFSVLHLAACSRQVYYRLPARTAVSA